MLYRFGISFCIILIILLTSCIGGHLGNFVIENKTQQDAVIELSIDTNFNSISGSVINYRLQYIRIPLSREETDSVISAYQQPEVMYSYLSDSITMSQLFDILHLEGISIYPLPKSNPPKAVDFYQSVGSYYNSDSSAISQIISGNRIKLFLPSNHVYVHACYQSCGDCGCEAEDALTGLEIKINCSTGSPILINRANVRNKAKKESFESNDESLVLELK